MNSMATSSYLPLPAAPQESAGIGHELAAGLHDIVASWLTGKQPDWMVVESLARSLHLQLDELVDSLPLANDVAERVVTVGYAVDLGPRDVLVDAVGALEKQQWQRRAQFEELA